MAGSKAVLQDGSTLSQLDRTLNRLETVMAFLAGTTVLILIGLAVVSVLGRNFFNVPLPGYVDWIMQAMPLIAFLGVAFTMREGGHIRMDIVIGQFRGRPLWMAEFLTTAITLVLMILLVWGSWSHFQRSFDWDAPNWSRDSTIDIGLPLWPAKLLVPVSFAVLCLRLVLQLWAYAKGIGSGREDIVAVPLVKSAAEQAAEEAEHVSGAEEKGR